MKQLLIIEDGHEYEEFARLFLGETFTIHAVHSAQAALAVLGDVAIDCLLVDLRFDRAIEADLVGEVDHLSQTLFAGNRSQALEYIKDNQGALVLAELRRAGHDQPAVFVHDFPKGKLANLQRLYGRLTAVPSFDAATIRAALLER